MRHPFFPNWKTGYFNSYAILRYTRLNSKIRLATPKITPKQMLDYTKYLDDIGEKGEFLALPFNLLKPKNITMAFAPVAEKRFMVNYWQEDGHVPGTRFQYWVVNGRHFRFPKTPILLTNWINSMNNKKTGWNDQNLYGDRHAKTSVPYIINLVYKKDNPFWYEIVIVNHNVMQHPLHFHGFVPHLIGYGYMDPDMKWWSHKKSTLPKYFNYDPRKYGFPLLNEPATNCARGDTFIIPPRGFGVFRIEANNPGVWILHCHMDFHLLTGLASLISVADENTGSYDIPPPPRNFPVCGGLERYLSFSESMKKAIQAGEYSSNKTDLFNMFYSPQVFFSWV